MATRSTIWIKQKDGSLKGIYCHNDGYLANNGAILLNAFDDIKKIESLISLGNISSLGAYIEPIFSHKIHDFDNKQDDTVVSYARDRGEALSLYSCKDFNSIDDYLEEYNYIFDLFNNTWYFFEDSEDELKELTKEAILKEWDKSGYLYTRFAINILRELL